MAQGRRLILAQFDVELSLIESAGREGAWPVAVSDSAFGAGLFAKLGQNR